MQIAILEDDPSQSELLNHWLTLARYQTEVFAQGQELLAYLQSDSFDALLLEWNVPDLTGLEVLLRVRQTHPLLPVLFCSSRGQEQDAVKALRAGADAYLIKPLRHMELLERLQSVLRRCRPVEPSMEALSGIEPLHVDFEHRTISHNDRSIKMTIKDFDLSVLFLRNIGRMLPRNQIRQSVWGNGASISSRTLDTHVSRIRTKLCLTKEHGWHLAAVYGHGYRLERADAPALHQH